MEFPFVGTRLPARVAQSFLQLAKVGVIDPESGDYLPPVRADTVQTARDVVLASDAVGAAPLSLIARDIQAGRLVALKLRAAWLCTSYGFVYRRDRLLSPAAEAFIAEVRAVEAELTSDERRLCEIVEPAYTLSEAQRR
jgi:DNA-binding transcriptional LysR family regulator